MRPQPSLIRRRGPFSLRVWRNPLARGLDRAEAAVVLLLVAVWLVTLPIVATVGSVRLADASAEAALQRQSETPVQAVVQQSVQLPIGSADAPPLWVTAPARWTGADGQPATGVVEVPATAAAGDRVTVWLDDAGRVVPAPASADALAGLTIVAGAGSWFLIGVLILLVGWAVRHRLDRRRLRAWEREWSQVEPGRHPF